MAIPLLTTKLYIPPVRPELVSRPRLIERLNAGLYHKLTLISAPAGFGKTTLLSEWVAGCGRQVAWLSLDEGDNDPTRFLAYLVAALQTIEGNVGQGLLAALQSPGPVNVESVLTILLNEIAGLPDNLALVLDDYHVIESQPIDKALTFTLDHRPPQMHLVIASRIDPSLPLSRLRARGQMTEIRADDLRFTLDEVAAFLDKATSLDLSAENVVALESHTEGWIAGLQLAALAMQGTLSMQGLKQSNDVTDFVNRFTGSDRYIQDYLADEVLQRRPKGTKEFLLQTSILNRLSGPLCDAVRFGHTETPSSSFGTAVTQQKNSQAILEALEAANLFIVPLDNERRWYRYHHLFADLLRQRLHQNPPPLSSPPMGGTEGGRIVAELHIRASAWYEENGLEIEALHHAAAANDFERAVRLVEGDEMPLYFRGEVTPVLNWLESLPKSLLVANPSLWVIYAEVLLITGRMANVEEKLQAVEATLQDAKPDVHTQDLLGRITFMRATMLIRQRKIESVITLARRALDLLRPDNLVVRAAATWVLGYGYQMDGDRDAASQAYAEALEISQTTKNIVVAILAATGLGDMQAAENQLLQAAQTYQRALQWAGEHPLLLTAETYLGLARIFYEWNDLDAAQHHGRQSVQLAQQTEASDVSIAGEILLARLKLARGDVGSAVAILDEAKQSIRQHHFVSRIPEVAAVQILTLLHQGDLAAAARLAQTHELPISQARVHLAQGGAAAALAVLEPLRQQMEAKGWQDETLKVMVLQAVALHRMQHLPHGKKGDAVQLLGDALALAEPGGFIRTFVDEGAPMAQLLVQAAARGMMPDYTAKLLAAFEAEELKSVGQPCPGIPPPSQPLVEPLSQRELEVLQLVAQGLSNREISERLFLALNTVKGHNRRIFGKLQVQRRTEAVARARELGLL